MWKPDNSSRPWLTDSSNSTSTINASALLLQAIVNSSASTLHWPVNEILGSNESEIRGGEFVDCIPPSISEFPDDFFTPEQRLHGGILVHAAIVVYVCSMLAIVCDRYFVPSLSVISNYFQVPPDIAGATFMAVGTSSPELFSSVIGAFIAKGDIGIGTVVGSAVFNILAVTGASGLAIWTVAAPLDWYPITRDCLIYVITVAGLVIVIHDNVVTWLEATVLLLMFFGYLILLYFNRNLQNASLKTVKDVKDWWYDDRYDDLERGKNRIVDETTPLFLSNHGYPTRYTSYEDSACPSSENSSFQMESSRSGTYNSPSRSSPEAATTSSSPGKQIGDNSTSGNCSEKTLSETNLYQDLELSSEYSFVKPPASVLEKIIWVVMWPANLLFFITIPNCTAPGKLMWFPLTFLSSIIWLGILSYLIFWMVAIIGFTLGIPDTVSGITILAAGTSVPELVASVIVVKSGLPNMAISNLIGSNIFDILFCLGLPWLVKTLMNTETHSMVINSSALTYTTIMLLLTVVLFYLALMAFRWKLSWRVGVVSLCLYALFLVIASLYESNVFGDFNPPVCSIS